MVKVWIHEPGGTAPFLLASMSYDVCAETFDLTESRYLQPLGEHPPSAEDPGLFGDEDDPERVIFEVPEG